MARRASLQQRSLLPPPDRRRRRELPKFCEQLLERKLPVPQEEYSFGVLVGRQWRFDYAWPAFKVAYEYEGGTYGKFSRHTSGQGHDDDCDKYNRAQVLGWIVIRGTAKSESDGRAIADVVAALKARGWRLIE